MFPRLICPAIFGLVLSFLPDLAQGFEFHDLPRGKSVTLPRPAATKIPLSNRVRLTATDRQQTLKLSSVSTQGAPIPFTIAIFDDLSEKVRYVRLKPGASMVYSFSGINSIELLPMAPKGVGSTSHARLHVESNRPLGIGR